MFLAAGGACARVRVTRACVRVVRARVRVIRARVTRAVTNRGKQIRIGGRAASSSQRNTCCDQRSENQTARELHHLKF